MTEDGNPLRVLVAEDEWTNRVVLLALLERLGCAVTAVSDGVEAAEAARSQPFDLILMDLRMPNMDGLAAARQILSDVRPTRAPRIFAVTANSLPGAGPACLEAGMLGLVPKPVTIEVLAEVVAATPRLPA